MTSISRREFVAGAAVSGLWALDPGGLLRAAAPAGRPLDLAVARWSGEKKIPDAQIDKAAGKLAEKAIEALGGMSRFVKKGDVVLIKPNIGWNHGPALAANTNPEIVAALIRLCLAAGAKTVKVGDNTCNPARKTYETSGIAAAAEALGAKVVYLDKDRFRKTAIRGERVKDVPLYPEILDCDLVINVPIAKHHVLSKATLCMKNYMGVIENRGLFHQDLPSCLTDLTRYMKPRLCLLDAVRTMTQHGPSGGRPEFVKLKWTVAAGTDIVALDAFGAELLGHKPRDIATVVKADKAGLGKMDYRKLAMKEIAVS
jgi:uncharacterized protein (DUF362 family)